MAITNRKATRFLLNQIKHLLWSLLFLKQYNTEEVSHAITGADEKTLR